MNTTRHDGSRLTARRLILVATLTVVVLSLGGLALLGGAIALPSERTLSPQTVFLSPDGYTLTLQVVTGECGPDARAAYEASAVRHGGRLAVTMRATNGLYLGLPSFGCSAVGVLHRAAIELPYSATHGLEIIDGRTGASLPVKTCDPDTACE